MSTMLAEDWLLDQALAPDATDDLLAPLYQGAGLGELVLPFCDACDLPLDLDQQVCDGCGADRVCWRDVERSGTVHSVTVMHRRETGLVVATGPYPILDVELVSGHRLIMTTATATDPEAVPGIGDPVTVTFRRLGAVSVPCAATADPTDPRQAAPPTTEDRP